MLYFAYGSNTNQRQMLERCPTSIFLCSDTLIGYSLTFNKKGIDNTGKANIIIDGTSVVYGSIYKMKAHDIRQLDVYEGLGYHYLKKVVTTSSGYKCFVYIAVSERCDDTLNPSKAYKRTVLTGLRSIKAPTAYIKSIERLRVSEPRAPVSEKFVFSDSMYHVTSEDIDAFLATHPEYIK